MLAIPTAIYALPGNYRIFGRNASFLFCHGGVLTSFFAVPHFKFMSGVKKIASCKEDQYLCLKKAMAFMINGAGGRGHLWSIAMASPNTRTSFYGIGPTPPVFGGRSHLRIRFLNIIFEDHGLINTVLSEPVCQFRSVNGIVPFNKVHAFRADLICKVTA